MDSFHIKAIFFIALVIGSIKAYPFLIKKANEPGTRETSIRDKILIGIGTCVFFIAFLGFVMAGQIFVKGLHSIDKDPSHLYNRSILGDILIWTALYIFIFVTILWIKSKISELIVKAYNRALSAVASGLVSHDTTAHLNDEERDKILDERDKLLNDFFKKHLLDETQIYSNLKELDDVNFIRKNLENTTNPKYFD